MRQQPTTQSPIIDSLPEGSLVCVLQSEQGGDGFTWFLIDRDPVTRRIETAFMREDVIRPLHPTPTPSQTLPAPPTITPTNTALPVPTWTPESENTVPVPTSASVNL